MLKWIYRTFGGTFYLDFPQKFPCAEEGDWLFSDAFCRFKHRYLILEILHFDENEVENDPYTYKVKALYHWWNLHKKNNN